MNIAFWSNQLCERGVPVALFDYAFYNQTILNNKSYIFYDKNHNSLPEVINRFKIYFTVHETDDFKEVDEYLLKYNITHIYIIKYGIIDNHISKVAKNCIHCVFDCTQPHGDVYASVSGSINNGNPIDNGYPIVPHMINLPNNTNNMRNELNIPDNAVVFAGYGGANSFSIDYVKNVVYNIAKNNSNIYFLFANFYIFCPSLPNIIHIPVIFDLDEKVKFINTSDAMLWARADGETFGLSIAEFSTKNKPIIATAVNMGNAIAHYYLLKDKAFWYNDEASLVNILLNFNPENEKNRDWNAYKEFTPEKIIKIFENVFLK